MTESGSESVSEARERPIRGLAVGAVSVAAVSFSLAVSPGLGPAQVDVLPLYPMRQ